MPRLYCPDHPDELLFDSKDPKQSVSTAAWVLSKILVCPKDRKAYDADDCLKKPSDLG